MPDGESLQTDIDKALRISPIDGVVTIRLAHGSCVLDLESNVDVYVEDSLGQVVEYSLISQAWAASMELTDPTPDDPFADIHATGGPLIIVRRLTGDVIVRAVRHYRQLAARG